MFVLRLITYFDRQGSPAHLQVVSFVLHQLHWLSHLDQSAKLRPVVFHKVLTFSVSIDFCMES